MPMKLGSQEQTFASRWQGTLTQMRKMLDQAGGKPLSDSDFESYRTLENEADDLAGRVANILGTSWGPRIDPSMSRAERLQTRENWAQRPGHIPTFLEDTGGDSRGGYGGGGEFRSLGEQLQSIVRAGQPGQAVDQRLYSVRGPSGLNEGLGAEGGFLVSSDFSTSLLDRAIESATLAPRCNSFPIGANANEIKLPRIDETSRVTGSRFGGVQLYWTGEGNDLTPSKPKFGQLTLKPTKLTGLVYLTDEIVQDSTVLENYVRQCFTSEYAWTIDDCILNGDGAAKILGVF